MAATNIKEAIVEGDEETRGLKRVSEDKDTRLAKKGKVEGKGDGTQEGEEEVSDKAERLCGLLKDKARCLTKAETEELIRHGDVNDLIRWASKSWQVGRQAFPGYLCLHLEAGEFVPSTEKVERLTRLMLLGGVEKLKAVDLYIVHNNFSKAAFASMLLRALDSYCKRRPDGSWSWYTKEMRADMDKACSVLSWKLLAHVMYRLTLLPVFKCTISAATGTSEEEDEIQKKAAGNCDVCYGKGKHSGVYGYYCSYWQSVPRGVTVGARHMVVCSFCGNMSRYHNTWVCCFKCGCQEGKAVPKGFLWDTRF